MAENVGYATLQIIPSVRGIGADLRRQLVGPAGDAGQRAGDDAGGGLSDGIKGALAALSLAELGAKIGEELTEAFSEAIDQGNVRSKLQAQLGATGKDASKYGKIAGSLYSSGVSDTFEDAADAIKNVAQSGLLPPGATNKQLESIATKASDVASTFGQDFESVTNASSRLIATGLVKNSGQALDLITKGFQTLGPKADDLLDTFNEYSVQFQKLGLDGQTSLGLIQQGIKAGARDTDLVADAIKEFSIRAVDGSATTIAGFKGLGLSAQGMAAQIGKGGKSAASGLDTVLDRLRKVPDPVKRAQLATDLFGTQSEDLGKALFALDPSKATKAIGNFGGAAAKVGKTIRSGPSYEITLFKRTLQQGLVNFLGSTVIPVVSKWGNIFVTDVLPPVTSVAHLLAAVLVPTLTLVGAGISGTVNWLKQWGIYLAPLAIAIGGVTLALNANAIATAFVTGVFSVYRTAILIGTAVTNGFAGAQAALNAVMALNPITLIVIALVALGAAVVIAWKKSDTFRAIVMGAWQGIQTAASYAWTSILKPALAGIVTAFQAVGAAASWLWTTVLSPVFSFIATAAKILLTVVVVAVLLPIIAAFKLLAAAGTWLWQTALGPAFSAIGAAATWLWTNAIGPVVGWIVAGAALLWAGVKVQFNAFMAGIHALGAVGTWLWRNVFSPVVGWIVAAAGRLWSGVKVEFDLLKAGIRAVGSVASWLWHNAIKPAFDGVSSVISGVWNKGIKPVFNALKSAVHAVGSAFGTARDAIKKAWNQLEGIAKKPVGFIINTVYDKGIVPVWNKVAGAFGAPSLKTLKFATGGILPGYTPGRDVHLAALSGGEAVMRPEWTRAMGPGYVNSMNALASRGGVGAVQKAMGGGLPAFKSGGIFGWIGSAASAVKGAGSAAWSGIKKGAKWLKDSIEGSMRAGAKAVVNPLVSLIPGGGSGFGALAKKIPGRMLDAIFGYAKTADSKVSASLPNIGGSGVSRWRPYVIKALAANHLSTSASMVARVLRQISTESGGNPKAVQGNIGDINNKTGDLAKGLMQTISATFNRFKFPGHGNIFNGFDNLLAALNYAKHRYGPSLSFLGQGHGYDSGGWLQPGVTRAVNKTGKPEAILTGPQWQAVAAQAAAGHAAAAAYRAVAAAPGSQTPVGLQPGDAVALRVGDHEFTAYIEAKSNATFNTRLSSLAQRQRANGGG